MTPTIPAPSTCFVQKRKFYSIFVFHIVLRTPSPDKATACVSLFRVPSFS